jgi:hypothetical protein
MQSKAMGRDADDLFSVSENATPEERLEAMEWRKIIEKATAGLNADLDAARSARSPVADLLPEPEQPQSASLEPLPAETKPDWIATKLPKIAYSLVELRRAPPQTLNAALLPYAVAAGVCILVSGAALTYFVAGSSSADVTQASDNVTPSLAAIAREEGAAPAKGGFQRAQAQAAPALPSLFSNVIVDAPESAPRPAANGTQQAGPSNWSETVETFREFVKAEVQKSSAKTGSAH